MAEALYRLGDELEWSPLTAPRGQLLLLQDTLEAGGAFLVHHFTSLFLKAGRRVCLVAGAESPAHYDAVGRKLGVNFAAAQAKKQLEVLDWFTEEPTGPDATLAALFTTLAAFCRRSQFEDERATDSDPGGVTIVLDDLSPFKWRFGELAVVNFVRCCKTLTHQKSGAANLVLLSHADTELPTSLTSRPLNPTLADMATVVLTTTPLSTGYSKDVHGTLTVHRQSQGLDRAVLAEDPVVIPYKILESTVKCFHSGGDALQWN